MEPIFHILTFFLPTRAELYSKSNRPVWREFCSKDNNNKNVESEISVVLGMRCGCMKGTPKKGPSDRKLLFWNLRWWLSGSDIMEFLWFRFVAPLSKRFTNFYFSFNSWGICMQNWVDSTLKTNKKDENKIDSFFFGGFFFVARQNIWRNKFLWRRNVGSSRSDKQGFFKCAKRMSLVSEILSIWWDYTFLGSILLVARRELGLFLNAAHLDFNGMPRIIPSKSFWIIWVGFFVQNAFEIDSLFN